MEVDITAPEEFESAIVLLLAGKLDDRKPRWY